MRPHGGPNSRRAFTSSPRRTPTLAAAWAARCARADARRTPWLVTVLWPTRLSDLPSLGVTSKPSNLMTRRQKTVELSDLGAKLLPSPKHAQVWCPKYAEPLSQLVSPKQREIVRRFWTAPEPQSKGRYPACVGLVPTAPPSDGVHKFSPASRIQI